MKELILHIGCGKTGTSALQSWLAINQENLHKQHIHYAGQDEDAKAFKVSSGNASMLIEYLTKDAVSEKQILKFYYSNYHKAIISGEGMQPLDKQALEKLVDLCNNNKISIRVISYIRNLYDLVYSGYVQGVKRKNLLNPFLHRGLATVSHDHIDISSKFEKYFNVDLIHYDSVVENIATPFCELAGIDYSSLEPLSDRVVNRSLSYDEIIVIQMLGRWLQISGLISDHFSTIVSDDLIHDFPNIKSEVLFDERVYQHLVETVEDSIRVFNVRIKDKFGFQISILNDYNYPRKSGNQEIDKEVLKRIVIIICENRQKLGIDCLRCLQKEIKNIDAGCARQLRLATTRLMLKNPMLAIRSE